MNQDALATLEHRVNQIEKVLEYAVNLVNELIDVCMNQFGMT
jgi:hypothetical protein